MVYSVMTCLSVLIASANLCIRMAETVVIESTLILAQELELSHGECGTDFISRGSLASG